MRKFLIAAAVVLASTSAQAQHRHYHHGGGGSNWVAPLVGGVIAGGLLYGLTQPRYAAPPVYVQPRTHRACGYEDVYDTYGRYLGARMVCREYEGY